MKIAFEELTIYEVQKLHKKLLKKIKPSKSSFTLNFVNVTKIDLSSIQLMLSVKKYCEKNEIDLKVINVEAKQVKNTFNMFNLNQKLGVS